MKTVRTYLIATALLLVGHILPAQQQAQRSAAEALEIEQANQVRAIPPVPQDEGQPSPTYPGQVIATTPAEPALLRTAAAEKMAAQQGQVRPIPAPPVDEKQQPSQESVLPNAPITQPATAEKAELPSNREEVEAAQHRQNVVRRIPAPPKEEPKSNQ